MAGFNRFSGGGLNSLYPGIGGLGQGNLNNRRDDRLEDRRDGVRSGFFERRDDRDFGRLQRDSSPRRRRYSPDPPYNSMRGRRDDRADLGSYSMDHMGGHDSFSSRGLNPQLAQQQQQQQLMAMVQTQSLLAAIQAQASAAVKRVPGNQPPSLLQGMNPGMNQGMNRGNERGYMDRNRKRRMSPNSGQMRNRNQQFYRQQNRQNYNGNRRRVDQRRDRDRMDKFVHNKRRESGSKSDDEPIEEPYIEENPDDEEEDTPVKDKKDTKEPETPKQKTEEPLDKDDKPAKEQSKEKDDKSVKEQSKEKEDQPAKEQSTDKTDQTASTPSDDSFPKSSINLAGQNVDKLVKSLFDRSRGKFVCKVCKIMCTKETCFRQHLFGRRHVKTWLENQGQSFEAVIFKKATEEAAKTLAISEPSKPETSKDPKQQQEKTEEVTEKKEEEKQPSETKETETTVEDKKEPSPTVEAVKEEEPVKVEKKEQVLDAKYSCDSRKMAVKDGKYITIMSINESRVKINGFDTEINTEGCEFVKAVSGFQCRLCRSFITNGRDVMKHVRGRKHQTCYRMYMRDHPKYETNQKARNKELDDMLSEKEGEIVLLYEVSEEEEERQPPRYRSRKEAIINPIRYVAAEEGGEGGADESMEDRNDVDRQETEPNDDNSQDKDDDDDDNVDDNDQDNDDDNHDEEDVIREGEQDEKEHDISIEDDSEDNQNMIGNLLQDTEEEKINSEEIANVSIEGEVSLSELVKDVSAEEQPPTKKPKTVPATKRGRRTTRGGAQTGRGRGRARAVKKTTRQSPKATSRRTDEDDLDMMDGFEVVDELSDEEN